MCILPAGIHLEASCHIFHCLISPGRMGRADPSYEPPLCGNFVTTITGYLLHDRHLGPEDQLTSTWKLEPRMILSVAPLETLSPLGSLNYGTTRRSNLRSGSYEFQAGRKSVTVSCGKVRNQCMFISIVFPAMAFQQTDSKDIKKPHPTHPILLGVIIRLVSGVILFR